MCFLSPLRRLAIWLLSATAKNNTRAMAKEQALAKALAGTRAQEKERAQQLCVLRAEKKATRRHSAPRAGPRESLASDTQLALRLLSNMTAVSVVVAYCGFAA